MRANCRGVFHFLSVSLVCQALLAPAFAQPDSSAPDLWKLANDPAQAHRFSTLFCAQDVRDYLSSESGLDTAIQWCKRTGVTKVYIEVFRDGYRAERKALENAKKRFLSEGFVVSGCVTTTRVGKPSTAWSDVGSCYTDPATQTNLQAVFEYAAGLFDEIMIDDFWFEECACPECDRARRARTVTIGARAFPVSGDSWEDYRCELMTRLSVERLLAPAKRVNPKARLIIKYPQWYESFQDRGYEVARETADFDRIWVGTETRDYTDRHWGGTVQYEAYFIMRWLGGIGGPKCGGGWFDSLGTTERTYIEQARQTVLGGAGESMLFSYGSLQQGPGPKDILALRGNVPELLAVAREVRPRAILGLAAYKPANSHPRDEQRVFDFVGMMGIPLVPCHEFPSDAPAAFFSVHALKDTQFAAKLGAFIKTGRPVLLTDGLSRSLANQSGINLDAPNVRILPLKHDPKSLLQLGQQELDELRAPLLRPLNTAFRAPNRVGLYLFQDGSWVVENFADEKITVELNGKPLTVAARGWTYQWK
ncbi:MAG: hypothetical protein ACLQVX_25525 [Limisphaerales bacterium]